MALDPDIFKQLEDTVARVVRERWIPLEDDVEETGEVSQDVIDEMKEMGLF
ncbi:MAG: acyl-CoA dehydrogenase, partial [Rhodospirillaceae bacterium]|nr:acyl-CoA dehydrogenase [Rhodospirillaceae bacterium]